MTPFDQVCRLLPRELRSGAERLSAALRSDAEEFRLRVGQPPTILCQGREHAVSGQPVTREQLSDVLEIATHASAHTALERMRAGFLTVEGGHRIGICGSAVVRDGAVWVIRELSSLNLRIARAVPGLAEPLMDKLGNGRPNGILILSEPGGGKTTLLRDLIRCLSLRGERVGIADERGELAGLWKGVPQFDIGPRTDVLDGCPKAAGLLSLLRGMNESILAVDEIAIQEDVAAIQMCAHCGVRLLATAHAGSLAELKRRTYLAPILRPDIFSTVVTIHHAQDGTRHYASADWESAL